MQISGTLSLAFLDFDSNAARGVYVQMLLLMILGPIVAFVLLESYAGPRMAVIGAVVCSLVLLGVDTSLSGSLDTSMLIEPFFILLLGALSLKMKSPLLFRIQPAVVGFCSALFLLWFQIFDIPFLVKYQSRLARMAPEEFREMYTSPHTTQMLATLSYWLIPLVLLHSLLMWRLAYSKRNWVWVSGKLIILPMLLLLTIIVFARTLH